MPKVTVRTPVVKSHLKTPGVTWLVIIALVAVVTLALARTVVINGGIHVYLR